MMLRNKSYRLRPSRLTLAAALFAGAASFTVHAQQHNDVDPGTAATPVTNIFSVAAPDLAASNGLNYSSSNASTDVTVDPGAVDHLDLGSATQPPPRRRYGRPRYNDSSHNSDGSNKYEFEIGAGFTAPIGNTYHYLNTQFGAQVGGGRDFSKKFGVLLQFDYDRFGFNGRTIGNQLSIYDYGLSSASPYYLAQLDGNSHIWSFTLNPHYNFVTGDTWGAYVVGGGGFFHKVANFTTPETSYAFDGFGYYQYTANEIIDHYTSNAPGFNAGFGATYKPSRFSGQRLFVEGRYNLMLNSQRTGITVQNINTTFGQAYAGSDLYPANSNRSTWLAYKAGIRF